MTVDFEQMRRHLTTGSRLEAVLRGHLWAEVLINGAIESALKHPDAIQIDRMSFSAKIGLAHALGVLPEEDVPWFRSLNKMRNRLAHDLAGAPTDSEIAALEVTLGPKAQAFFDSSVNDYENSGSGRLVLLFAVQLVRLEYARRLRVYEAVNHKALQHLRLQMALHEVAGEVVTDEREAALRERWGLPPEPTVWEVIGRTPPEDDSPDTVVTDA